MLRNLALICSLMACSSKSSGRSGLGRSSWFRISWHFSTSAWTQSHNLYSLLTSLHFSLDTVTWPIQSSDISPLQPGHSHMTYTVFWHLSTSAWTQSHDLYSLLTSLHFSLDTVTWSIQSPDISPLQPGHSHITYTSFHFSLDTVTWPIHLSTSAWTQSHYLYISPLQPGHSHITYTSLHFSLDTVTWPIQSPDISPLQPGHSHMTYTSLHFSLDTVTLPIPLSTSAWTQSHYLYISPLQPGHSHITYTSLHFSLDTVTWPILQSKVTSLWPIGFSQSERCNGDSKRAFKQDKGR